jgi:hypothetical protein
MGLNTSMAFFSRDTEQLLTSLHTKPDRQLITNQTCDTAAMEPKHAVKRLSLWRVKDSLDLDR